MENKLSQTADFRPTTIVNVAFTYKVDLNKPYVENSFHMRLGTRTAPILYHRRVVTRTVYDIRRGADLEVDSTSAHSPNHNGGGLIGSLHCPCSCRHRQSGCPLPPRSYSYKLEQQTSSDVRYI
jgi:hypothetical protein